jgi:methyltransferase (TIGR00027 family)
MNLATVAAMLNGRASSTARHNALFRALEAGQPADRRVVDDPLARRFLGPGLGAVAAAGRLPGLRTLVPRLIDGRWPGVRTAVVARTRLIDDAVAEAMGAGGGQAVLLGAGFDTRAWRLPGLAGVPVFEVDHPATQAAKRRALPAVPPLVRLVPCDFAADDLGLLLAVAGLRPELPALVLWEGVTNYLDEPAVDRTLRWCAGCAPGSVVIMTYVDRAVLTDPGRYAGAARLRATLERVGERFTFGLDPGETPSYLADRGLALVDDVGAPEFRRRAYGARAEAMVGHEFYRVARAVVPER